MNLELTIFQGIVVLQQLLFTIAYLPQILQLLKTKSSGDISTWLFIIRVTALILLEWAYCMMHEPFLIIANAFSIIPECLILGLVIAHKPNKEFYMPEYKEGEYKSGR